MTIEKQIDLRITATEAVGGVVDRIANDATLRINSNLSNTDPDYRGPLDFSLNLLANETIGGLWYDSTDDAVVNPTDQGYGTWGRMGLGGATHNVSWITGDGILTVVPEAGTIALLAVGGLGMLRRRRRR